MHKSEAVAWFGSQHKLAKFLGVAQSNVSAWKTIPRRHQKKIEAHTKGELQAEPDTETKERYMCTIEREYIQLLKIHAEAVGVPIVEILRRSIRLYDQKNRARE